MSIFRLEKSIFRSDDRKKRSICFLKKISIKSGKKKQNGPDPRYTSVVIDSRSIVLRTGVSAAACEWRDAAPPPVPPSFDRLDIQEIDQIDYQMDGSDRPPDR